MHSLRTRCSSYKRLFAAIPSPIRQRRDRLGFPKKMNDVEDEGFSSLQLHRFPPVPRSPSLAAWLPAGQPLWPPRPRFAPSASSPGQPLGLCRLAYWPSARAAAPPAASLAPASRRRPRAPRRPRPWLGDFPDSAAELAWRAVGLAAGPGCSSDSFDAAPGWLDSVPGWSSGSLWFGPGRPTPRRYPAADPPFGSRRSVTERRANAEPRCCG